MENIGDNLTRLISAKGVFPVLFIAVWVGISYVLSRDSVWAKLQTKYALSASSVPLSAQELNFHTGAGSLGKVRFEGVMLVASTTAGIVLKMRFPMSIGHPPLLLPWNQISSLELTGSPQSQGTVMGMKLTGTFGKKSYNDIFAKLNLCEFSELELEIPWHDKLGIHIQKGRTS